LNSVKIGWLFRAYVYIDQISAVSSTEATTVEWKQWAVTHSESDDNNDTPYTS